MHESLSAPTTLQRNLMKLWSWKTLLFEVVLFFMISPWLDLSLWLPLWKSSCLITLEIWSLVLNLVLLSSKSRLTKRWFHNKLLWNCKCVKHMFKVWNLRGKRYKDVANVQDAHTLIIAYHHQLRSLICLECSNC